ncbi:MAG: MBL fold metallo-hydrolase [Pseudomonadota bacterium]
MKSVSRIEERGQVARKMVENGRQEPFVVRFWGVRGSIACPGPEYVRYGGNTSCIEIRLGKRVLIFDAGTGLRPLGRALIQDQITTADIFLTHTHVDHIHGIPFFAPFFNPKGDFRVWAGHLAPRSTLKHVLSKYMADPLFPVPPDIFAAKVAYVDFEAGETLVPAPGALLRTTALNHPQGATAFRLEEGGRSFCYVTDTEHVEGVRDERILALVEGADYMAYDATYTDNEYPAFRGWGHSTWEEGMRLAEAAGVKQLVIFHHDPAHDDNAMDAIAASAEAARPGTLVAYEGLTLTL